MNRTISTRPSRAALAALVFLAQIVGACGLRRDRGEDTTSEPDVSTPPATQPAANVPAEYESLYQTLDSQLATVESHWQPKAGSTAHPVAFSTELLSANTNLGDQLLTDRARQSASFLLDRFKEMGFKAVSLDIHYPFLHPSHPQQSGHLSFYRYVASEIRKRGLKMSIEFGTVFADPAFSRVQVDYSNLTLESFQAGLAEMGQIVIDELQPDWLGILNEPDTQSTNTGLKLTPKNFVELVGGVADRLDRGRTRLGAGAGTWAPLEYFERLAAETTVDDLNLHIYPIHEDWMTAKIDTVADLASRNGKGLAVGEAWLYKATPQELSAGDIAAAARIYARDVYSFWEPLDRRFLQALVRMSGRHKVQVANFFWSRNFFGSVEYSDSTAKASPQQAFQLIQQAASSNIQAGKLASLGDFVVELLSEAP